MYPKYFKSIGNKKENEINYNVYEPVGYPIVLKTKTGRVLASVGVFFDDEDLETQTHPIIVPFNEGFQILFPSSDDSTSETEETIKIDKGRPIKYVITNHCHETGYIKIDLGLDKAPSNTTDPPENINRVNELKSFCSYEVKSNQLDGWKQLIVKTKKKQLEDGTITGISLDDEVKATDENKTGSYIYLCAVPQKKSNVEQLFKETYWSICSDIIIVEKPVCNLYSNVPYPNVPNPNAPYVFDPHIGGFPKYFGTVPNKYMYDQTHIPAPVLPIINYTLVGSFALHISEHAVPATFNNDQASPPTPALAAPAAFSYDQASPPTPELAKPPLSFAKGLQPIAVAASSFSPGSTTFSDSGIKSPRVVNTDDDMDYEKATFDDSFRKKMLKSEVAEIASGDQIINQSGSITNAEYAYDLKTEPKKIGLSIMSLNISKKSRNYTVEEIEKYVDTYIEEEKKLLNEHFIDFAKRITKYRSDDCVVCLGEKSKMIMIRCGHICSCSVECTKLLNEKCPLCLTRILCSINETDFKITC